LNNKDTSFGTDSDFENTENIRSMNKNKENERFSALNSGNE